MNIAIIDDQQEIRYSVAKILQRQGHKTVQFNGLEGSIVESIQEQGIELLVVDVMLSDSYTGIDLIKELQAAKIQAPVILMTAYTTPENMIEASKLGVKDILQKPFDEPQLIEMVAKNTKMPEQKISSKVLINSKNKGQFIGSFETMQDIYQKIGVAANNDLCVLVYGQTGTGKELIANLIHSNSQKRSEPFVALNCASIPAELFESQLFGHEKGSFTGAEKQHIGMAEQTQSGTLFLDEIGELDMELQSKLLRFLETKTFRRVGGTKDLHFQGRVISATNVDLKKKSEEKIFREDLYFRLSILSISMPTLANRISDIPILCEYFIDKANKELRTNIEAISKKALEVLAQQPWRGNIRELRNTIYSACLNAREKTLGIADFVFAQEKKEEISFAQKLEKLLYEQLNLTEDAQELERSIRKVFLATCSKKYSNISALAEALGIARNTLKKQLKEFEI